MNSPKYCYEYPRPAVTTDCVIFRYTGEELNVLLIKRANEPFKDIWALPGGFIQMDETAGECAQRELFEETGITTGEMEQFYTFTTVDRDPRGRTISISYFTVLQAGGHQIKAGDDAAQAGWFSTRNLPSLAFDHDQIINMAIKILKEKERSRI